ncbi:MAG: substrate-binding domain-containing protein [Spirochaetaceae bacterium]
MRSALLALIISVMLGQSPAAQQDEREPEEKQADRTRIVVFTPTTRGNAYWPEVYAILEAAAEDLDIELMGYEFDVGDRFAKHTEGLQILRETRDIDGAIFSVAFGEAKPLVEEAQARGFPVMIQGPLFSEERDELGGGPRQRYDQWIGSFAQSEEEKGYRLAKVLLETAHAAAADGTAGSPGIAVAGIGGDPTWEGSAQREQGVRRAVREDPEAELLQIVPTRWSQRQAQRVASGLLGRYEDLSVIWAASDQLAVGAATAARRAGVELGTEMWIGGLDLSPLGLQEVENGRLTATVASPLFSYAEVLIYLYDYIHGYDFADSMGTEFSFSVHSATESNAGEYLELYSSYEAIDFAELSKVGNPAREEYDFSLRSYRAARRD